MNINRHNYEEFFLLYVDNELSAKERNAVESFVQQNPDLEKELQLLQHSIISDEDIFFSDKQSLMKADSFAVLQEKLLLFADNELPFAEMQAVESLLATDAAADKEWKILQRTILPAEAIVFEDKRSLYRIEGGRVIGIRWWRIAAAAILLGFGLWIGVSIYKNNIKGGSAKNESIANKNNDQPQQIQVPQNPVAVNPVPVESSQNEKANNETVKVQLPEQHNKVKDKLIKENKNAPQKDNINLVREISPKNKPDNNLPKPNLENLNNQGSNNAIVAIVQPKTTEDINALHPVAPVKRGVAVVDKYVTPVKTSLAKTAGYSETAEDKNDTKILYMDEDKVKRTMIGGIFRKLKRVIERKTNIKTGNGIKVAGFEIAIK